MNDEVRSSSSSSPPDTGQTQRRYPERKPGTLRRVPHGIKLRVKTQDLDQSWIARQWLDLIESIASPEMLHEGMVYARSGQTVRYSVEPGLVQGLVQGRSAKPFHFRLQIESFDTALWIKFIEAMAAEAMFITQLVANELPSSVDDLLAEQGFSLVPTDTAAVSYSCDCGREEFCQHITAVAYLIAAQLNREPLTAFTLRGLHGHQVVERLKQTRAIHTHGVAVAHADPMIPESRAPMPPLEMCLEDYWRAGARLSELQESPPPPHAPHALLRRLGPSPLKGKFPLVGLLASVYGTVSESAIQLRDQAEHLNNGDE